MIDSNLVRKRGTRILTRAARHFGSRQERAADVKKPDRPVHDRDPLGRHRVDLRNIRSPWLRYGIAAAVVVGVLAAARLAWRDDPLEQTDIGWLVPWLGWGLIGIVVLALALRIFGRRR